MTNSKVSDAVEGGRKQWQAKHGKCSMCAVGDKPVNGQHRGQFHCGNDDACIACRGCLPQFEQCQACGRIETEVE